MTEKTEPQTIEIGYATSIKDYIVWANGLPNVRINEIVISKSNAKGLVSSIKEDGVEILLLDNSQVAPQESFGRTFKQLSIPVGSFLLGRTVNPLGQPIDGKGGFKSAQQSPIEQAPPPIKARELITRQFETGITLIDTLIPLAFGQKELVIGDSHSGKTSFLIDIVSNQRGKNIVCVYCLIGKPVNEIKRVIQALEINKAFDYTVAVTASSSDRPSLIYLTPITAMAVAEYFQKRGSDVLVILDDLGLHAKFYREIALLSKKPPGRESYPGDIFYQHARLIERSGCFNKQNGGGSITTLPVIEATNEDFTSFMTTNLMGMTDGHLLFDSTSYHQGIRPAVDISLSVSRVGRQTQMLAQKSLADKVKALLAQSKRLETYARLGSEVSPQTQMILKQSAQINEILKQPALARIPTITQMILLGLTFTPFFAQKDLNFVGRNKQKIIEYLVKKKTEKLAKEISNIKDSSEFIKSLEGLTKELEDVCK